MCLFHLFYFLCCYINRVCFLADWWPRTLDFATSANRCVTAALSSITPPPPCRSCRPLRRPLLIRRIRRISHRQRLITCITTIVWVPIISLMSKSTCTRMCRLPRFNASNNNSNSIIRVIKMAQSLLNSVRVLRAHRSRQLRRRRLECCSMVWLELLYYCSILLFLTLHVVAFLNIQTRISLFRQPRCLCPRIHLQMYPRRPRLPFRTWQCHQRRRRR